MTKVEQEKSTNIHENYETYLLSNFCHLATEINYSIATLRYQTKLYNSHDFQLMILPSV